MSNSAKNRFTKKTPLALCGQLSMVLALSLGIGVAPKALAATPTPLAGLDFLTQITIPNWTTSGATQASTDIWSFDPSTNTLYFADRINKGVSVIGTDGICSGLLRGEALIGGVAFIASSGTPVAKGTIQGGPHDGNDD
jgi:hypothetical protein